MPVTGDFLRPGAVEARWAARERPAGAGRPLAYWKRPSTMLDDWFAIDSA
jgi:hypothetical protein